MLDALSNFHFIRPWWLLLAPVVFGLWWYRQRQLDPLRGWRSQMDADLLQALRVDEKRSRTDVGDWWLAGSLLALLSVAGPTWRLEPSPFADDAAPLIILLKASDSMDRANPSPSPMERAKFKISDLAEARKGQPLGLIAYAGSAHLVLPPTRDTSVVAQMASEISPAVMPVPGDRLDLAIQQADELFSIGDQGGALLVIADSIEADTSAIAKSRQKATSFPIYFLTLAAAGSPEEKTIEDTARSIHATVQQLTVNEKDVTIIANAAARLSLTSVVGKSSRWQEFGYWLVPVVAIFVLLSFRRESPVSTENLT